MLQKLASFVKNGDAKKVPVQEHKVRDLGFFVQIPLQRENFSKNAYIYKENEQSAIKMAWHNNGYKPCQHNQGPNGPIVDTFMIKPTITLSLLILVELVGFLS